MRLGHTNLLKRNAVRARIGLIRAAFWARATTALKRITERADETSLERAVAAPTDAGALARAISDYPGIGGAVEELDPLAAAIARGAEQKVELLKQAGGALSITRPRFDVANSSVRRVLGDDFTH